MAISFLWYTFLLPRGVVHASQFTGFARLLMISGGEVVILAPTGGLHDVQIA